jgi:hypothetical protein
MLVLTCQPVRWRHPHCKKKYKIFYRARGIAELRNDTIAEEFRPSRGYRNRLANLGKCLFLLPLFFLADRASFLNGVMGMF